MLSSIFHVAGLILLDAAMLGCLLLIPIGLPGNFILLGLALLVAWLGQFQVIGWVALLVMLALVILAEVVEALLGSALARKFGASWWGVGGAFVGGIVGAVAGSAIIPLIGTLVGAFLGAAVGAVLLEVWHQRRIDENAFKAGWGALLGKVLATLFKTSVAMGIIAMMVIRTH
jgi:uncharacterized protein